jgi:hypothetical protein
MEEIAPGLWHWTARHDGIGTRVSSYYVAPARIVIDPKLPEGDGLFELPGAVEQVVLTSGHHGRDAGAVAEAYGVPIRASRQADEHLGGALPINRFDDGEEVAAGVRALHIGVLCEDEGALHIAHGDGALAIADGIHRSRGELAFFRDSLLGDDPEAIKAGLRAAYRDLLELEFDDLLFAHGEPLVGGGKAALRAFTAD